MKKLSKSIKTVIDGQEITLDAEDAHYLDYYTWRINAQGYLANRNANMRFHNLVMGRFDCSDGLVCDHINQNPLDNRKCNLRIVDKRINALNSKLRSDNTSGYKGVSFDKRSGRWFARIYLYGKDKRIGTYATPEEAYQERLKVENAVMKELLQEYKEDKR